MKSIALMALLMNGTTAPTYDWPLTPAGWGPVRIGMSQTQTEKALQLQLKVEIFENDGSCIDVYSDELALTGLHFMFLDGKLSRISASGASPIKTPRGIGVGATEEDVRRAYGAQLQAEPHHYEGEPAEYLTYWLKPKVSGVRFETDTQRKVETIHAGLDSIQLIEGCA